MFGWCSFGRNCGPSSSDTPLQKWPILLSISSLSSGNASAAVLSSSIARCTSLAKSSFETPKMNLARIVVAKYLTSLRISFCTLSLCCQPDSILLSSQVKYGPILREKTSMSISVIASCDILRVCNWRAFKSCAKI